MAVVDPETPEEWRIAVDAAYGALCLDAARQYGLIEGGPAIDAVRCVALLERGAAAGFHPSTDAAARFAVESLR